MTSAPGSTTPGPATVRAQHRPAGAARLSRRTRGSESFCQAGGKLPERTQHPLRSNGFHGSADVTGRRATVSTCCCLPTLGPPAPMAQNFNGLESPTELAKCD